MSLADANKRYFNDIADNYDSKPWFADVNRKTTDFLRARLEWLGIPLANTPDSRGNQEVRLLDYACGPGLISRIYGPYVTVTRGVDIAPNMVRTYNDRARAASISESVAHAVVGDIFAKDGGLNQDQSPQLQEPDFRNFDLAVVGFGFHHFEDVTHAAKCLNERLKPGGVLVITDFLEGGDVLADENGDMVPGSEGNHMGHAHQHHHGKHDRGHGHEHGHNHGHIHGHGHDPGHEHDETEERDENGFPRKAMKASIVVPSFTIAGVKKFFTEAGFVDVDVITMEKVYMQFSGTKLWRTILVARGRRPEEGIREKPEL